MKLEGTLGGSFKPAHPPSPMETLNSLFLTIKGMDGNISGHMDTLRSYAQASDVVCELGVGLGHSTTAFLLGQPTRLFSFDHTRRIEIQPLLELAHWSEPQPNIWEGRLGSTLWTLFYMDSSKDPALPCDTLFIDTWHAAPQLKAELDLNHHQVRKWIILHDTETYGLQGEGWQDWEQSHDGKQLWGLRVALDEFQAAHPEWQTKEVFTHNNGLTVLERVS